MARLSDTHALIRDIDVHSNLIQYGAVSSGRDDL